MKEFTVDYISALTKVVNETRDKLFDCMKWKKKLPLSDGDVRIVMEVANNQEIK